MTAVFLATLVPCVLSACGSSSYADQVKPAMAHVRAALTTYDEADGANLQRTGAACLRASSQIEKNASLPRSGAPSDERKEVAALRQALALMSTGFHHCGQAARSMDFPLMAQADREIADANQWLRAAQHVER
jgi:hypothetical protein